MAAWTVLEKWLLPKESQQNEAKRRGHGAEAAIARVLKAVGCRIVPEQKDTNPMGAYDPNISLSTFEISPRVVGKTFSSDIAVLNESNNVRVALMGLVQSSDPGQFGVNKSDEIVQLRAAIDAYNGERVDGLELWGLVDGVGYSENKVGTINKMLRNFHYFVQNKSAYKAPLRAHALGLCEIAAISFDDNFYSPLTKRQMTDLYVPNDVNVVDSNENPPPGCKAVLAGEATLWIPE